MSEPKCDALPDGAGEACQSYVCKQCTDGWHSGCYEGGKCTCGYCTGDEPSGPVQQLSDNYARCVGCERAFKFGKLEHGEDHGDVVGPNEKQPTCFKTIGGARCNDCRRPVIQSQGIDLNEYALKHILPGAAQMCEEGKLREIAAQRDAKPAGPEVIWLVEVAHGLWETTSTLPHGMPPLQVRGKPGQLQMCDVYWAYVQHVDRCRAARGAAARKMARETVFMEAGRGCQS
jgi:hypothetical protein